MDKKISVIIPAYNEEDSLGDIIKRIKNLGLDCEIIVVDDGSSDNTAKNAAEAGAKVVRHPYNVGNGASVKSGAYNSTGDILVIIDADGQHPPEYIPELIRHMDEYDMVVGARTKKSKVSNFRTFGNWLLIKCAELLSGHKIDDLTSGFRAIKRDHFFEFISLYPNGYSLPTTITISMFKSGYFVKYVPIDQIKKRETGKSNIKPFKDGLRFLRIIVRIIVLFDPFKFFGPAGTILWLAGIAVSIRQIILFRGIFGSSILLFLTGLFVFLFGMLAEQISQIRRSLRS